MNRLQKGTWRAWQTERACMRVSVYHLLQCPRWLSHQHKTLRFTHKTSAILISFLHHSFSHCLSRSVSISQKVWVILHQRKHICDRKTELKISGSVSNSSWILMSSYRSGLIIIPGLSTHRMQIECNANNKCYKMENNLFVEKCIIQFMSNLLLRLC